MVSKESAVKMICEGKLCPSEVPVQSLTHRFWKEAVVGILERSEKQH